MVSTYIVTKEGRPQVVKAFDYRGLLLHPDTALPVIDKQKLSSHPEAGSLRNLLGSFSTFDIASAAKSGGADDAAQKKKFYELSRMMRNPALRDITLATPKPGLMAYKLYTGDYNFTPEETQSLSSIEKFKTMIKLHQIALLDPISQLMPQTHQPYRSYTFIKECLLYHSHEAAASIFLRTNPGKPGRSYLEDIFSIAIKAKSRPLAEAVISQIKILVEENPQLKKMYTGCQLKLTGLPAHKTTTLPHLNKFKNFLSFAEAMEDAHFDLTHQGVMDLFPGDAPEEKETHFADFLFKRIHWLRDHLIHSTQPMHDALLDFHLERPARRYNGWMEKIIKQMDEPLSRDNPDLVKLLRYASRIENTAREAGVVFKNLSPLRIEAIAKDLNYVNAAEDPELASLCRQFHISEYGFKKGIEARAHIADKDLIPDIGRIEGEDLGFPDYYMVKLKKSDPRILLVGAFVGCCNHLDGFTSTMALSHVTSEFGGCYALFKKSPGADSLINKTSVWIGQEKETGRYDLVFNSWEGYTVLREEGPAFLAEAAKRAMNADPLIDRILLGRNRHNYKEFIPDSPARPKVPSTASEDSRIQYLVAKRVFS